MLVEEQEHDVSSRRTVVGSTAHNQPITMANRKCGLFLVGIRERAIEWYAYLDAAQLLFG